MDKRRVLSGEFDYNFEVIDSEQTYRMIATWSDGDGDYEVLEIYKVEWACKGGRMVLVQEEELEDNWPDFYEWDSQIMEVAYESARTWFQELEDSLTHARDAGACGGHDL